MTEYKKTKKPTMAQQFLTLKRFLRNEKINADDFYSIEFNRYRIKLQGSFNAEIVEHFLNENTEWDKKDKTFWSFTRGVVDIIIERAGR